MEVDFILIKKTRIWIFMESYSTHLHEQIYQSFDCLHFLVEYFLAYLEFGPFYN